jgi:hypothetical protein
VRLTLLYPAEQEDLAKQAAERLSHFRNLDLTLVATEPDTFTEDLDEVAEAEEPLALFITPSLVKSSKTARQLWAPLLQRIERGTASQVGLLLLDACPLPPLLAKLKTAEGPLALRQLQRWVVEWLTLPRQSFPSPMVLSADLIASAIDQPGTIAFACPCPQTQKAAASSLANLAAPYFEEVHLLEARHQVAALRDAVLQSINTSGRILWILDGFEGNEPNLPTGASLIILRQANGLPLAPEPMAAEQTNPIGRVATLLPLIPNQPGLPLPCSTFEFETLLPLLFEQNWPLAERFARRIGTFFRLNHRVNEAIWLYTLLQSEALRQGHSTCAKDCEDELFWLRAGGERKQQFLSAGQAIFKF